MDDSVYEVVKTNRNTIIEQWKEEMKDYQEIERELTNINDDAFENTNNEFIDKIMNHATKDRGILSDDMRDFFERIIQVGWPLNYLTKGLQAFRRVTLKTVLDKNDDMDRAINVYDMLDRSIDGLLNEIVVYSTQTWRNTISVQKTALMELSAPLIPVFAGISVMPLIGTIDTERAKLIMENLLDGVINNRSEVVLIDITGVPVVDTMVAHHIIQAAEAVRLIGSRCILVGIRPEIAQTIVNLGIDLSDFPTRSTLLKGIESALELTNKKIESLS